MHTFLLQPKDPKKQKEWAKCRGTLNLEVTFSPAGAGGKHFGKPLKYVSPRPIMHVPPVSSARFPTPPTWVPRPQPANLSSLGVRSCLVLFLTWF
jgi:hypothetical protein